MRTGRCVTVTVPLSHHFLKHSEPQIPHAPSASSFPPLGWFAVLHGGVEGRTKRPGTERAPRLGEPRELGKLTQVVGAGPELGNLEPGGSGRNPQQLLIAERAPAVREVPRDEATRRIITPTDSTAIWTPARAEDPITAWALGKRGMSPGPLEAGCHLTPQPGPLGTLQLTGYLDLCTTSENVFLRQPHPHSQPASGKPGCAWGSLPAVHLLALLCSAQLSR